MSGEVTFQVILLFPAELRLAGKTLGALWEKWDKKGQVTGEEMKTFLLVAKGALYDLMLPGADEKYLALAADPIVKLRKRKEAN